MASLNERIDKRDEKTKVDIKTEMDELVEVLNKKMDDFVRDQQALILANPDLYPGLFASPSDRERWNRLHTGP
jgi:hypothetical protein